VNLAANSAPHCGIPDPLGILSHPFTKFLTFKKIGANLHNQMVDISTIEYATIAAAPTLEVECRLKKTMSDSQTLYSLINEIYLILDDGDRRLLNEFNLSSSRFYALVHIGERPGISLSDLSQLLICDKSNATRIVKGLEADALVYRQPHESDGRTLRLFLTEKGIALRNRSISAHQRYNNLRFVKLPATEQEALTERLLELRESLNGQLQKNAHV